jgi:DNA-directed RNA polymerase specialized sigma24 family protein
MQENHQWLANRFEKNRTYLLSVAYRMLGSLDEADETPKTPGCG